MDIPLQNSDSQNSDIYSLGFDKNLNRAIPDNSTGVVYDPLGDSQNAGQVLSGGSLTLKALSIGGLVKQVAPGDDIQAAIDAVSREGGGIVQLISGLYVVRQVLSIRAGVNLIGAGIDITVLDFDTRLFNLQAIGTSSNILKNFTIQNLTIRKSASAAGLDIDLSDFWRVENVRVTLCTQSGVRIQNSQRYYINSLRSDNNTGKGILFNGSTTRDQSDFTIFNSQADNNANIGVSFLFNGGFGIRRFNVINVLSKSNSGGLSHGFDFSTTGTGTNWDGKLVNAIAQNNGGKGFASNFLMSNLTFVACRADNNTGNGFDISAASNSLIGCESESNAGVDYNFGTNNVVNVIGCRFTDGAGLSSARVNVGISNISNSYPASTRTERTVLRMLASGGNAIAGCVVILNGTSSTEDVTTTTTNGDYRVFGVSEGGLVSTNTAYILTRGYTTGLLVNNSSASISVGTYLSAYSHAYYAKAAVSGDTAFAVSASAPGTGTALISALLIPPLRIP